VFQREGFNRTDVVVPYQARGEECKENVVGVGGIGHKELAINDREWEKHRKKRSFTPGR